MVKRYAVENYDEEDDSIYSKDSRSLKGSDKSIASNSTRSGQWKEEDETIYSKGDKSKASYYLTGKHSSSQEDESKYSKVSRSSQLSGKSKSSRSSRTSRSSKASRTSSRASTSSSSSYTYTYTEVTDSQYTRKTPVPRKNPKGTRLALQASLALQRRKKESPKLIAELEKNKIREVNYDVNPTVLYKLIESKKWKEAIDRCNSHPYEPRTWVYRIEDRGDKIRWRLLPLHTAVIFKAPVSLIASLIEFYSDGPSQKDDQSMLPLHLACRTVSEIETVRCLIDAYPDGINIEDRKGRVPIDFLRDYFPKSVSTNVSRAQQRVNEMNRCKLIGILEEYESGPSVENDGSNSLSDAWSGSAEEGDGTLSNSGGSKPPEGEVMQVSRSENTPRANNKTYSAGTDNVTGNDKATMNLILPNESSGEERDDNETGKDRYGSSLMNCSSPNTSSSDKYGRSILSPTSKNSALNSESTPLSNASLTSLWDTLDKRENTEAESDLKSALSDLSDERKVVEPQQDETVVKHSDPPMMVNIVSNQNQKSNDKPIDLPRKPRQRATKSRTDSSFRLEPSNDLKKLLTVIRYSQDPSSQTILNGDSLSVSTLPSTTDSVSDKKISLTKARRINACGALKALASQKKNSIKLARTKGVISTLCFVLSNPLSTDEERVRCISTMLFLCTHGHNWEVVFGSDVLMKTLTTSLSDDNSRVRHIACNCIFFLAKLEDNRQYMAEDMALLNGLTNLVDMKVAPLVTPKHANFGAGSTQGIVGRTQRQSMTKDEGNLAARINALKVLLSFSKMQDSAYELAKSLPVMTVLVKMSGLMTPEENLICVAIFTNMSRCNENALQLVYHVNGLVDALVEEIKGGSAECGKCAVRALQNLSCANGCRQQLANSPDLLPQVAKLGFNKEVPDSQIAALHTLKNLCDDPANVITMTNTPGVTATLLALANDKKNAMVQYLACDALATLSQWLRASAETCLEKVPGADKPRLPTLQVSTWNQWQ